MPTCRETLTFHWLFLPRTILLNWHTMWLRGNMEVCYTCQWFYQQFKIRCRLKSAFCKTQNKEFTIDNSFTIFCTNSVRRKLILSSLNFITMFLFWVIPITLIQLEDLLLWFNLIFRKATILVNLYWVQLRFSTLSMKASTLQTKINLNLLGMPQLINFQLQKKSRNSKLLLSRIKKLVMAKRMSLESLTKIKITWVISLRIKLTKC